MLADKYRPRQFKHVWCQEAAVTQLTRLAQAREGAHLLLTGAYGSGKTALVKIFARALNCENLTEDGSPCKECRSRDDADLDCLAQYDVPARGGDKDKVRGWVDAHNREPRNSKWKILFLDEAHALTPAAMDSLLKDLEEPQPRVAFAFATTEPWVLKPALKSRTLRLEVRPLGEPDAVDFMGHIARLEGITYDRDALFLIACMMQGHPRDMLNGLGQVARSGKGVTTEAVKSIFPVHDAESLIEYFLALGSGDAERQVLAVRRWQEPLSSKVKSVQTLLTSIFYNEIRGQKIVIDAFLDTLRSERAEIVSAFCSRLGTGGPSELVPYWIKMLEFWSRLHATDEEGLRLQFCLFEDLVNRRLEQEAPRTCASSVIPRSLPQSGSAPCGLPTNNGNAPTAAECSSFASQYLRPEHVREIINRSSFFIQHHGQMLNAAFTIYPSWQARSSERSAVDLVRRFRDQLSELCGQTNKPYASITVFERDGDGVLARVIAHVARLVEAPTYQADLAEWCESFESDNGDSIVQLEAQPGLPDARSLKFHWDCVLELCAAVEDADGASGSARQLLENLQVSYSRQRNSGPVEHSVLEFAGWLDAAAILPSCANDMGFLSAFDAQAWAWIRNGWERTEHIDRRQEVRERTRKLSDIERLWANEEDRRRVEIEKLKNSWAREPESRARQWRGWWLT